MWLRRRHHGHRFGADPHCAPVLRERHHAAIGIPVAVLQRRGNGIVSAVITKEVSVHLVGCVDLQAPTAVIDAHNRPWVAPRGHFKCKSVAVVDRRVVPKGAHFFRDAAKNAGVRQSQRNAWEANKKDWAKPASLNGITGSRSSLKREAPAELANKPKRVVRAQQRGRGPWRAPRQGHARWRRGCPAAAVGMATGNADEQTDGDSMDREANQRGEEDAA